MDTNKSVFNDKRAIIGLLMIVFGGLLLADNFGFFEQSISRIIISWPMLLIAFGLINVARRNRSFIAIAFLGIGIFFLVPRIVDVPGNYTHHFWPILLVIIGLAFIFKKKGDIHCWHEGEKYSADMLDDVNIFGGSEKKITTIGFKGGKITSIFGGSNYDFLDSKLADGRNVLDMVNVFGGSKLVVPSDWVIHVDVIVIFGGFADKRKSSIPPEGKPTKELFITGVAIFGGGEIRSI
jgi:predicted membrane protein